MKYCFKCLTALKTDLSCFNLHIIKRLTGSAILLLSIWFVDDICVYMFTRSRSLLIDVRLHREAVSLPFFSHFEIT